VLILDGLLSGLKDVCAGFSDKRKGGDAVYPMADIGLSAFSLFFIQSESFLAHQRELEEVRKTSNCRTLFGMAKIPADSHIRSMLDPVAPSLLQPSFDRALALLRTRGGLKAFERLNGRVLVALYGTEYFCSQKIGCPHCLTRKRAMKELRPVYLGDDLFACQPIAEPVLESGGDFLFTAKPQSHKALYDFMNGVAIEELWVIRKEAAKKLTSRLRWFAGAPLREGKDGLAVNWTGMRASLRRR
jgi:hypothetical protein